MSALDVLAAIASTTVILLLVWLVVCGLGRLLYPVRIDWSDPANDDDHLPEIANRRQERRVGAEEARHAD